MMYTKKLKKLFIYIFAILLLATSITYYNFLHNFSIVIPNQVYRSRQLSKNKFVKKIQKYHIQSVLNLRGKHPNKSWYQQEISAIHLTKVAHYNIAISGYKLPSPQLLKKLVDILIQAKRPLLIHCNSGVDRTGLASMIILILANKNLETVKNQISWHYFVLRHNSVGKLVLNRYQNWLAQNHLKHNKQNFLKWVYENKKTL